MTYATPIANLISAAAVLAVEAQRELDAAYEQAASGLRGLSRMPPLGPTDGWEAVLCPLLLSRFSVDMSVLLRVKEAAAAEERLGLAGVPVHAYASARYARALRRSCRICVTVAQSPRPDHLPAKEPTHV